MSEDKKLTAYLDNGDSTPMLPEVLETMLPYFTENFGNPVSLHKHGLDAETAVDDAREQIAEGIGASSNEIFFTSGATEANNLALNGLRMLNPEKKHVIISPVEHASIRNVVKRWAKEGWAEVTELSVDDEGRVNADSLREAIREDTLLASVIHLNNEIGTIQNLSELGEICREKGVVFHTDAAQTLGKLPLDLSSLPVDMASFNAHKVHGPKGIGALYLKKGTRIRRVFEGSPQENGIRPGTLNVPAIVGFAKALEVANRDYEQYAPHVDALSHRLAEGLAEIEHTRFNGPPIGEERALGNINITFRFIEGEAILMSMNLKGVHVSSGSACSSSSLVPSHVLTSIGLFHEEAHGSIRYTLSRLNTEAEIDHAIEVTRGAVDRLRAMTSFIPEQHSERLSDHAKTFYKQKKD